MWPFLFLIFWISIFIGKTEETLLSEITCEVPAADIHETECPICQECLSEKSAYAEDLPRPSDHSSVVRLTECHHQFHKLCLLQMIKSTSSKVSIKHYSFILEFFCCCSSICLTLVDLLTYLLCLFNLFSWLF